MGDETRLLTLAVENAELRLALAEAQEQCVELAVDAGELHATIKELETRLAVLEAERDTHQGTLPWLRYAGCRQVPLLQRMVKLIALPIMTRSRSKGAEFHPDEPRQ